MQDSLSHVFSSLFSDHFVSPVTDNLLFLNQWKRENIHERMCGTQLLILGLLATNPATVPDGIAMDTMHFYVIQTG